MAEQPQFQIHKLYVKDASFRIPDPATTFASEWKPDLNVSLNINTQPLPENNTHEVALKITCKITSNKKDAFEVEVEQAGIFELNNITGDQLDRALKAYCPNLLYPYVREAISSLVINGGFPQLTLAPVNFDALYQEQLKQKEANKTKH